MAEPPGSPIRATRTLTFRMVRDALRPLAARGGSDEVEDILRARTLRLDWLDLDDLGDELALFSELRELFLQQNRLISLEPLSLLRSLEVLVVAGNAIRSLAPLAALRNLRVLDASENAIETVEDGELPLSLQSLSLHSNPIAEHADRIAALRTALPHLQALITIAPPAPAHSPPRADPSPGKEDEDDEASGAGRADDAAGGPTSAPAGEDGEGEHEGGDEEEEEEEEEAESGDGRGEERVSVEAAVLEARAQRRLLHEAALREYEVGARGALENLKEEESEWIREAREVLDRRVEDMRQRSRQRVEAIRAAHAARMAELGKE